MFCPYFPKLPSWTRAILLNCGRGKAPLVRASSEIISSIAEYMQLFSDKNTTLQKSTVLVVYSTYVKRLKCLHRTSSGSWRNGTHRSDMYLCHGGGERDRRW